MSKKQKGAPVPRGNRRAAAAFTEYGGPLLAKAASVLCDAPDLPEHLDDVHAWLLSDLRMAVACPTLDDGWHRLALTSTVNADGTVQDHLTLAAHPDVDVQAERVMTALSGNSLGCLRAAFGFAVADDPVVTVPPGGNVEQQPGMRGGAHDDVNAIRLAVARSWARFRPTLDSASRAVFVETHTFPADWSAWEEAGISLVFAKPFLARRIPTACAQPWLERSPWIASGAPDRAVLLAASQGLLPPDDAVWVEYNFTYKQAETWHARTGLAPQEAARLRDLGYEPALVASALERRWLTSDLVAWATDPAAPAQDSTLDLPISPVHRAKDVGAWLALAPGVARQWRNAAFSPDVIKHLNLASQQPLMTVQDAVAWRDLGVPTWAAAAATRHGYSPMAVQVWGGVPACPSAEEPERWMSSLTDVLAVTTAMTRQEWEQWLGVVGTLSVWWREMTFDVVSAIVDAHRQGLPPHDLWLHTR